MILDPTTIDFPVSAIRMQARQDGSAESPRVLRGLLRPIDAQVETVDYLPLNASAKLTAGLRDADFPRIPATSRSARGSVRVSHAILDEDTGVVHPSRSPPPGRSPRSARSAYSEVAATVTEPSAPGCRACFRRSIFGDAHDAAGGR